jgi:hypothetical protein
MSNAIVLSDTELRIKGIEALNASLGAAAAWRFLSLLHRESTDYVAISRWLYEGQTIDDIFERARENWLLDSGGDESQ